MASSTGRRGRRPLRPFFEVSALKQHRFHAKEDPARGRVNSVDPGFLILVLVLLSLGLLMLWSASFPQSEFDSNYTESTRYLRKQIICAVLGLGAMAAFSRMDASLWRRYAWHVYAAAIALLLAVLAVGQSVNGAKRWVSIAGIQFQPSEIAKFAVILVFARLSRAYGPRAAEFRYGVLGFSAALLGILVPLALEKHLSAILLIGMVAVVMMFLSGTRMKYLLMGAALAGVFVLVYITFMGYAGDRVSAWLDPQSDPSDTGYQILQSLYAIGSGGVFGLGFGRGRQKYLYLPFQYNDYIFAIVCEELGLLGAAGIMALFAALILRGYHIARSARDRFSSMLCAGLTTLLAVQTVLNLCVVTNMLPSTGIALPFFSYGGTALAVNLGEMGIILAVSRQREEPKLQEEEML